MRYNTGNPLGSSAVKDIYDNAGNLDLAVNDRGNRTWVDRFGATRETYHAIESDGRQIVNEAEEIRDNLGFLVPVPYASGLDVQTTNFTVVYQDVLYAAQPGKVPFTTSAWDASQWYPIQTHFSDNVLRVFRSYAAALSAASVSPDGQTFLSPDQNNRLSYFEVNGASLLWEKFSAEWKIDSSRILYASWFGIKGDGSDESTAVNEAFSEANGATIDFQGLSVTVGDSLVSPVFDKTTIIRNGELVYSGARRQFALLINANSAIKIYLKSFYVNGSNLVPKPLAIKANVNGVEIYTDDSGAKSARSEASEGLAAGFYIFPETGVLLNRVEVIRPKITDVNAVGTSLVGRGLLIHDSKNTLVVNPDVRRVGPYQDGDGVFVVATDPNAEYPCIIIGGYYEDCQKRAIKSQVKNTLVVNPRIKRTQAFADGNGQCEIDLQYGGFGFGGLGEYPSGCVPESLVGGAGSGVTFDGFTAICQNTDDVIGSMASLGNFSDASQNGIRLRNITTNSKARCFVRAYSNKTISEAYQFDGVQIDGFRAKGLTRAAFEIARGATTFVKALVSMRDCRAGSGNSIPAAFLDPAAGDTSYLSIDFESLFGCSGFNQEGLNYLDKSRNILSKSVSVAENATGSVSVTLSFNRSAQISVRYANARNASSEGRLYMVGDAFPGGTTAEWIQRYANLSSAGLGALSVSITGQTLTFTKSAGSLSGSGRLQLVATYDGGVS